MTLFLGQFGSGQLAQLVIYQRQEPLGGAWIASLNLGEYLRDVGHEVQNTAGLAVKPSSQIPMAEFTSIACRKTFQFSGH